MADFILFHSSAFVTMTPITQAAKDWIDDNIAPETVRLGSGQTIVVERPYLMNIVDGATADGLSFG